MKKDKKTISFDNWTIESGIKQAGEMLNKTAVDSIFCANDLLAIGAISAVKEKGLRVPEDVSVNGFDDIQFVSHMSPKLTTIYQPVVSIASQACNLLIDRIEDHYNGLFKGIFVEPDLIIRESA